MRTAFQFVRDGWRRHHLLFGSVVALLAIAMGVLLGSSQRTYDRALALQAQGELASAAAASDAATAFGGLWQSQTPGGTPGALLYLAPIPGSQALVGNYCAAGAGSALCADPAQPLLSRYRLHGLGRGVMATIAIGAGKSARKATLERLSDGTLRWHVSSQSSQSPLPSGAILYRRDITQDIAEEIVSALPEVANAASTPEGARSTEAASSTQIVIDNGSSWQVWVYRFDTSSGALGNLGDPGDSGRRTVGWWNVDKKTGVAVRG